MTTWTTATLDHENTVVLGLSDETPKRVFFSGDALTESSEPGVGNVSDDTAGWALAAVGELTGVDCRFVGWETVDDEVVGELSPI